MGEVLLRVGPQDYARLMGQRRKAAVAPVLLCLSVATAIIVVEYQLMLIAFMVLVPAIVAVVDVVAVARSASVMKECEVRCEGDWLALNASSRLLIKTIAMVRVQPDSVTLVEELGPRKFRAHLIPADGAAQGPLLAQLRALGREVRVETATIAAMMAFIWGVLANLILGKVAAVLVLGAIGFTIKGFVDGPGPGWEAAACFGGAVVSVTVMALLKAFVLRVPEA